MNLPQIPGNGQTFSNTSFTEVIQAHLNFQQTRNNLKAQYTALLVIKSGLGVPFLIKTEQKDLDLLVLQLNSGILIPQNQIYISK